MQYISIRGRRRRQRNTHVCYVAEFRVIGIDGKEILVRRHHVGALRFCKHGFEGMEPPSIPLEGI